MALTSISYYIIEYIHALIQIRKKFNFKRFLINQLVFFIILNYEYSF